MLHICKFVHLLIVLKNEILGLLYRRNGEFWNSLSVKQTRKLYFTSYFKFIIEFKHPLRKLCLGIVNKFLRHILIVSVCHRTCYCSKSISISSK